MSNLLASQDYVRTSDVQCVYSPKVFNYLSTKHLLIHLWMLIISHTSIILFIMCVVLPLTQTFDHLSSSSNNNLIEGSLL
jgi:hypothetical protein